MGNKFQPDYTNILMVLNNQRPNYLRDHDALWVGREATQIHYLWIKTWHSLLNGPHDWNVSPEGIPALEQYSLMDYGLNEPFELLMY